MRIGCMCVIRVGYWESKPLSKSGVKHNLINVGGTTPNVFLFYCNNILSGRTPFLSARESARTQNFD